jgi:hypothetical protein
MIENTYKPELGQTGDIRKEEEYQAYLRGFKSGALMTDKRDSHALNYTPWIRIAYRHGYEDGMKAREIHMERFCRRIGYNPTLLRG